MSEHPVPQPQPGGRADARRKRLLAGLAGVVVLAGAGYAAYWYAVASHYVATDNAYTAVESAQITASVAGIVRVVHVTDTQAVRKGDVLVQLDPIDVRLALSQAEAEARQADARRAAAGSEVRRAGIDLKRRLALEASGSVSGDEVTRAQDAMTTAGANLAGAQAAVALARARVEQARVDLDRTVIRSPVDGVVARRQVQLGQRVALGTPLLSVVPVQDMHVDANFKEGQLARVRVGQPATVQADIYGGAVTYHGRVAGFSGGTGAAFSAIPAQNATGNWIKVVQRLPVRIALDAAELAAHPLKVGLSMSAEIDTRER
ncbi:efflux RND transporter periplasmic adaptor subunit [Parasulfuritortus cantonensis]|uniref:Efflux RND transporter periplasmic adaptor subunit n=1 Tax=Parasulfuritortus cantonensis TaxID=2528202 RepID=A0A4R1B3U7_9PROT|nr:efflux RND transporter periplasmic adaptor subunit [Parasulfuritortus cantonensis]TCJ12752.1 efflux RND transporter periplasmic adaptor subunit [Parasulfuritortus cantonensis]